MSLKLHHLNASRSQRLVWLIEELGVPCEIVHYQRHPETNLAPPDLLNIHPLGKSPLLEDGGVVIAETGAIAEYLLARHDAEHKLHPRADSPDFPRYLEWVHSAEGAVFLPGLMVFYLTSAGLGESELAKRMMPEIMKTAQHIEAHLAKHAYFAGDTFSAADCLMGFQIQSMETNGALAMMPKAAAWLEKVRARPAYKRMLEIGI